MKTMKLVATILVLHAWVAAAGHDPAARCVAAKIKAGGKRFAAVAKCRSKAVLARMPVDQSCLQKVDDKFLAAFEKAELHGGCTVTGDAGTIGDDVDTCADAIDDDLARVCGDGIVAPSEACDDGNATGGDGCSATCTVETGFQCTGDPSVCMSTCGDGVVASDEACDDGNQVDGDGCSAACAIETGFTCAGSPSVCTGICGDGLIRGAETCDDGGTSSGDGCSATCTLEGGWDCSGEPTVCTCSVHADLSPAEGLKIPQLLTQDATGSYSGCGLPLQYFWWCQSDCCPSDCADFLATANSNGNTNATPTLNIENNSVYEIRLTACIAGTSICAPQISHVYTGAKVDL